MKGVTSLKDRTQQAIDAGHSRADLARAAGVESAAVSHWLAERTKTLKAKSTLGLSRLTGWSAEWWATGKGPREIAAPPAIDGGTPAYMAELTAKLAPAQQERLVAFAELLAGPHGDRLRFSFVLAERDDQPTKKPAPHR
jgi:hypothetical protein